MRAFANDRVSAPPRMLPPMVPSTVTRCAPVMRLPVTLPRTVTSWPNANKSPLMVPSTDTAWPIANTVSLMISSAATVTPPWLRRISNAWPIDGSATTTASSAAATPANARWRTAEKASQATNASTSAAPTKFNVAVHIAVPSEMMKVTTLTARSKSTLRFEWVQPL